MSDPRNVIACVSHPCETTGYCPPGQPHAVEYQPVLDLPDAEHIHFTRHPDGTITAEDADERLRRSIAAHRYLGSLEEWRPIYDKLPVQMRSIIMHVQGEHDDPIGCYEHCALCHAVRSPSRVDCPTGGDQERGA